MKQKENKTYDVAIIGAGPGGYVAAIRAAQLKLNVILIEKDHLGGICLNYGCIPTKSLLKSAEIFSNVQNAKDYGVDILGNVTPNLAQMVDRSRKISSGLNKGIEFLLKKNNVDVIFGSASINKDKSLNIENKEGKLKINTKNIIIATGARSRVLPNFSPDNPFIWYSKEAMLARQLPKKLIIIGSGAIGVEFASFYSSLGTKIYIIEAKDRILPLEDSEISAAAASVFKAKSMDIFVNAKIDSPPVIENDQAVLQVKSSEGVTHKLSADKILVAIGNSANIENIGIENTKIKLKEGRIIVNEYMQTDDSNIFAIGDVVKGPWLAHKASREGIIAVEKIANIESIKTIDYDNIPSCTYSMPQIASFGLTEQEAKEQGRNIKIGRSSFSSSGKAMVIGKTEGFIKTIFDAQTDELLGMHAIGSEVTELISNFVVAKQSEAISIDLASSIFPHPTLSEILHESILSANNKAIH